MHTGAHTRGQVDILGLTHPPVNDEDDLQGVSAGNWIHDEEDKLTLLVHEAENETERM